MLIKLHGIFAKDFGSEFRIEADTVADAIEGFVRQVDFYTDKLLEDRPVVRAVGFNTAESLYEKTEQETIHLVPAMIGGGGKWGRIILGTALIVAGTFIPIPGVGQILMTVGITMVLSGAMDMFMKAPSVSKDKDPEASQYLGIGDNTVNIGTYIPLQWGLGPATGHVLAINVDSSEMIVGTFPTNPT